MEITNSLLAPQERAAGVAFACQESTLPELLSDPLTRALMKADRVDVGAFEEMLHAVAGRLPAGGRILAQAAVPKASAAAAPYSSLPDYMRWTSFDGACGVTAPRSICEMMAGTASEIICGSNCSW